MTALSDIAETGIDPLERFLTGGDVFETDRGVLDPAETRELLAALRAVDVRALLDPADPDSIEHAPDEDPPWQELIEDLAVLREFVARAVGGGRGLYLFMSY
jgi:hypothetical protein